ncbi:hypothetical protein XI03_20790 [Bradyrhizobium sp. CCBAU 65884]|nr:hypothetical protein [Bradyrhizobium sp. CCBAU 65884]
MFNEDGFEILCPPTHWRPSNKPKSTRSATILSMPRPFALLAERAAGTDAGGKVDLPANSNISSDSAPILAAPTMMETATGTDSAGSARRCATPTSPSIPTMDEFQRSTNSRVYCREGFQDVVLIDTGDETQAVRDRVCSGVRVGSGRVLTAKHCLAKWTPTRGRIFELMEGAFGCLDRPLSPDEHPGERCGLPLVERNGQPPQAEDSARKIDLALIRVLAPPDARALSLAKVRRFVQSGTLEITLAWFGAAPGSAAGTRRVGWSRIDATALRSLIDDTDLNTAEIAVPIRFTQRSYGAGSPGSCACKGDSGSPSLPGASSATGTSPISSEGSSPTRPS